MSQKNKERIFYILLLAIAVINIEYLSFNNYLIRLAVRIPQAFLVFYVYRKFVNKDLSKLNKKFELEGLWHYITLIIGIIEFLILMTLGKHEKTNETQSLIVIINLFHDHFLITLLITCAALILIVPCIYAIIYSVSRLRDVTIWFYVNKIKYFIIFLIFEDVFTTCMASLLK